MFSVKVNIDMIIDIKALKKQINDLLESNISEDSKTGLHNLLGEILDKCEEKNKKNKEEEKCT